MAKRQHYRTLPEDRRGFAVEIGKHRNLLNSAGSGRRKGTLGYRTSISTRGASKVKVRVPGKPITRRYNPPRKPLHEYLQYVERFPNVLDLWRSRPTVAHDVAVNLGAGRGW